MNYITKTMRISSIANAFLVTLKIVTGLIGNSSALIADGLHSLSDFVTDFIAIIGGKLSNKPADDKHPYGHGNVEYLTSIIIGLVIVVLGLLLIKESISKNIIIPSLILCIVSVLTIIVKYAVSKYVIKQGKKYANNILISSGKESMMDTLSSLIVLVSIILMQFTKQLPILKYADVVTSILIGIFIIKTGFEILKVNISTILGEKVLDQQYVGKIEKVLMSNKDVKSFDNLIIIKYGPYYKMSVDILFNPNVSISKSYNATRTIEHRLKSSKYKISYVAFNVKPYVEGE